MILNEVIFERLSDGKTLKSYEDLGLLLAPYTLEIPQAQENYIDIPGRDGKIDLTEILGQINYDDRKLDLCFTSSAGFTGSAIVYGQVANFLHGQKAKITLGSDPDFYLIGRCSLGNLNRAATKNQIEISANCEPFRYKQNKTVITQTIGELPFEVKINNSRMLTTPTITTTANVLMNFENCDYALTAGEHLNTSIILKEGENLFTFKTGSSGDVTFSYQEGTF